MNNTEIKNFAELIHANNIVKGFYEEPRSIEQVQCLFHSEVSEAFEILRKDPDQRSEKIPEYSWFMEEIADLLIRVLDTMFYEFANNEWDFNDFLMNEEPRYNSMENVPYIAINDLHNSITFLVDEDENWNYNSFVYLIGFINSEFKNSDLWETAKAKVEYNTTRPYKHNKIF